MTDLEIAKTLKDAAQYIRDHGWCQRTVWDVEGGSGVCALGAIAAVEGRWTESDGRRVPDIQPPYDRAAVAACEEAIGPRSWWLGDYNDVKGRTAAEVVDLFESVALQHELRALAVTTLSQDAAMAVCDNTVPEAVNA